MHQVLEDCHCEKLELEEKVAQTETQLKELLGLGYLQVNLLIKNKDNASILMQPQPIVPFDSSPFLFWLL